MPAWQNMPPLTALRAFAALAEAGSAQAAGGLLNVSHAAVSQQIKALEAHMGLGLVVRGGRRLELTEEGTRLAAALELGFGAIRLMTNNPAKISMMEKTGVKVVERVPLVVGENAHNHGYLKVKAAKSGHLL